MKRLKIAEDKDLCIYSSIDFSMFKSFLTRENPNLESDLEHNLSLRMKKYLPGDFDLVDYDRELLKKQLDLETVTISLSHVPEKDIENDGKSYYKRDVTRMTNEDGMNMRLFMDLQKIGQEYGVSEDDLNDLFFSVSCSKGKLIEALKGQSFTKWNELEDMALGMSTESTHYKYLLKVKGAEEIVRRKKFLGI